MNKAGFAKLCNISKPMVTKYSDMGLVVIDNGNVDVMDSLMLLEGRLDETKRQAALAAWAQMEEVIKPVAKPKEPIVTSIPAKKAENVEKRSAKAEKDEVDLALRKLEYAQKAGLVVSVKEVEERALEAVSALREVVANEKREAAKAFCARFDLPPEYEGPVSKFLTEFAEKALGRFAEVCTGLANAAATPAQVSPSVAAPAVQGALSL